MLATAVRTVIRRLMIFLMTSFFISKILNYKLNFAAASKQGHALGVVPGRSRWPTILAFGNMC